MRLALIVFMLFAMPQIFCQDFDSYMVGSATDLETIPNGGVCLMGGAGENDSAMVWFLEQANGGDVLVLRASGGDGYNDYFFSDLGVSLNSVETIVFNNSSASSSSYIHEKIKHAEAIWIAGGDQWDYISYWRDSPIDSLINAAIINRGIVIGGTSAGMAIQGDFYFSAENGTITSSEALNDPFHPNCTVDTSSFLDHALLKNVITDTHFDAPDRKGRLTVFIAKSLAFYGIDAKGIACDEYTAVCIGPDGIAHVYGSYPLYDDFAYFIAPNCELIDFQPEYLTAGEPLTWNHSGKALNVYKVPGNENGTNSFNTGNWYEGTGGDWLYWSVNEGVLLESLGEEPTCILNSTIEPESYPTIYPNPATEIIHVPKQQYSQVKIYDLTGKLIVTSFDSIISVVLLSDGIYTINWIDVNGTPQKLRFIKTSSN